MGSLTSAQVALVVLTAAVALASSLFLLILAVVGYFLRDTHGRAKTTEQTVAGHTVQIAEMRVEVEGVNGRLDEIKSDVRTGNQKLDSLTAMLISQPTSRRK